MAEATTKTVTAEDVPPNVMKLIEIYINRHGKRRARELLDNLDAIHSRAEEGKRKHVS